MQYMSLPSRKATNFSQFSASRRSSVPESMPWADSPLEGSCCVGCWKKFIFFSVGLCVRPEVRFHRLHQCLGAERLGDIAGTAGHAAANLVEESVLAGDHDHGHILGDHVAPDQFANLIAVHS